MTERGGLELVDVLLVEDDPGDVLMTREAFEHYQIRNNLYVVGDGEHGLVIAGLPQSAPVFQVGEPAAPHPAHEVFLRSELEMGDIAALDDRLADALLLHEGFGRSREVRRIARHGAHQHVMAPQVQQRKIIQKVPPRATSVALADQLRIDRGTPCRAMSSSSTAITRSAGIVVPTSIASPSRLLSSITLNVRNRRPS